MYLLDTDVMSLIGRGAAASSRVLVRLGRLPKPEIATSVISYEEQLRGWLAYVARLRTAEEQATAYERLLSMLRLYCATTVLPFDRPAAQEYTRLRGICPRLGAMDLKIAAIALTTDATLVTCNLRHFEQVPELRAEDWTR